MNPTNTAPIVDLAPGDIADATVRIERDGYVVIPDAIGPSELATIRERYDALMDAELSRLRGVGKPFAHVEVKRIIEADPVFEPLMDHPRTYGIARAVLGRDISLADAGQAGYRPPRSPSYIPWHNDFMWMPDVPYPRQNFWVRCFFFIDDVTEDTAPFALVPGSHHADGPPPAKYTDSANQPLDIPGMVRITGKAGTCLINNTEIWHANMPNTSDRPRKIITLCYKHAWMRPWEDGYGITPAFADRQTDPLRKQLCGQGVWHRLDGKWEA